MLPKKIAKENNDNFLDESFEEEENVNQSSIKV